MEKTQTNGFKGETAIITPYNIRMYRAGNNLDMNQQTIQALQSLIK